MTTNDRPPPDEIKFLIEFAAALQNKYGYDIGQAIEDAKSDVGLRWQMDKFERILIEYDVVEGVRRFLETEHGTKWLREQRD